MKENLHEKLPSSRNVVLIIEDEIHHFRHFEKIKDFSNMEIIVSRPRDLGEIQQNKLDQIQLILADQFQDIYTARLITEEFIKNLTNSNNEIKLITISFSPLPNEYAGSIGFLDTYKLTNEIYEEMETWPKSSDTFISKLVWLSNNAFKEAQEIEQIKDAPQSNLRYNKNSLIRNSYERLYRHKYFSKLLEIAGLTQQQFIQSFYDQENAEKCIILHCSWQIVGNIVSEQELPVLTLQRLLELIKAEDEDRFIAPPTDQ